jgi:formiminotetrahydrofolate cyclodeaminase
MALVDLSIRYLLSRFSAPDPTPGGGSASALASALGRSLLLMVAALPKTRNGSDDDRAALAAATTALTTVRDELTAAIDADTLAYDRVVAAYKLPKESDEQQAARKEVIQQALRDATDVPLGVMTQTVRALEEATAVAAHGHKAALSDIGVAIALLTAGATGAKLNVDANLDAIADSAYRDQVGADSRDLLETAAALSERCESLLR